MRVVTWNCKNASATSRIWDYLLELGPDLAFLQEVGGIPKSIESRYSLIQRRPVRKTGSPQSFTIAILVRGSVGTPIMLQGPAQWVDAELDRFAGNLVGVELQPDCGQQLRAICVYSPAWPVDKERLLNIDVMTVRLLQSRDVWVADLLWAALCLIKPQVDDPWIIAGDFNLCETFEFMERRTQGKSRIFGSNGAAWSSGLSAGCKRSAHAHLPQAQWGHGHCSVGLPICDRNPAFEVGCMRYGLARTRV